MAPNPFSVYASHFINASTALNKSLYPESESTEPLFFSVTEGSHLAQSKESLPGDAAHDDDHLDVDEDGYPRLVGSDGTTLRRSVRRSVEEYSSGDQYRAGPSSSSHHKRPPQKKPSDDPYLDDEDLDEDLTSPHDLDSMPLIASGQRSPVSRGGGLAAPAPGWLAHFSQSRNPSPLHTRVASPPSPHTSDSSSPTSGRRSSDSSDPPPFLDRHTSPPPTRTTLSESLLPRDGVSRSLFTLPEPHRIPRRKYNDSPWTALWCTALLLCGLGSIIVLFVTVSRPSTPEKQPSPYSTITRAIPLLTFIILLSSAVSYLHLVLLRYAVRPVLIFTGLTIPLCLFIGSAWSFAGSFFYEDYSNSTWGETVGLRIFSLIPLALAVISARSLYYRRKSLLRTVAVVELSTAVVLEHPPILGLSLCLLLGALVASLPFLSLILRLTLIGYYSPKPSDQGWHVRGYAGWLAFLATVVWIWSWGVVRGVLRVAVSGVVGSWFFSRSEPEPARPNPLAATQAAFARAHGASLGSICVATLVLTFTQSSIFILRSLRRITTPPQLAFLAPLHPLEWVTSLIAIFDSLSAYTLTYIGLTGDPFWAGSRRARELVSGGGRSGKAKGSRAGDYKLLSFILTLSSMSIALVAAVGGYIFAAHTLHGPSNAALMALLTGSVTFMTVTFGVGVGQDAADALFVCYRMDLDAGTQHCKEAFEAFEGRTAPPLNEP